jgi:hypothetical protein
VPNYTTGQSSYQVIDNAQDRLTEVGKREHNRRTDKAGGNRVLDDGQAFLVTEECHYFCFHYFFSCPLGL